jgi:hypothetical protein
MWTKDRGLSHILHFEQLYLGIKAEQESFRINWDVDIML